MNRARNNFRVAQETTSSRLTSTDRANPFASAPAVGAPFFRRLPTARAAARSNRAPQRFNLIVF